MKRDRRNSRYLHGRIYSRYHILRGAAFCGGLICILFCLLQIISFSMLSELQSQTNLTMKINYILPSISGQKIPKNIYITHKYNLCNHIIDSHVQQEIFHEIDEFYYLVMSNVEKIKFYNKDYKIKCYDNEMAYNYIKSKNKKFAKYFLQEKKGMYKADIFRIILLYHEGGVYFDSDMEPRMSLNRVLNKQATFSSAVDLLDENVFQSYLASTAKNPILKYNLDLFDYYYGNNLSIPHNMGTIFLGWSIKNYTNETNLNKILNKKYYNNQLIQLFKEKRFNDTIEMKKIIKKRSKHQNIYQAGDMLEMALYDPDTKLYPFWGRFAGYLNEVVREWTSPPTSPPTISPPPQSTTSGLWHYFFT